MFKVKASRVDKLQVELNSQRERLEESNRMTAKLKVSPTHYHAHLSLNHCTDIQELKSRNEVILEAKAKLEDEVESLQSKITQLGQSLFTLSSSIVLPTDLYCNACSM